MLGNKKLRTILLLMVISTFALADQLSIQSAERQVILNGPYPLEQVLVSFRSEGNVNVFKHAVPAQIDERISKIIFSKSK